MSNTQKRTRPWSRPTNSSPPKRTTNRLEDECNRSFLLGGGAIVFSEVRSIGLARPPGLRMRLVGMTFFISVGPRTWYGQGYPPAKGGKRHGKRQAAPEANRLHRGRSCHGAECLQHARLDDLHHRGPRDHRDA